MGGGLLNNGNNIYQNSAGPAPMNPNNNNNFANPFAAALTMQANQPNNMGQSI